MTFAVLCPGQGAQHAGMLDAALMSPAGRGVIDIAARTLGHDPCTWVRSGEAIFENAIAQPLVCVAQLGAWASLRDALPRPLAFAGYSVGELSSHGLAGALSTESVALLAHARAAAMDHAAAELPGALVAVRGLSRRVAAICAAAHDGAIAIANGDDAFVIGVAAASLDALREALVTCGGQVTCLRVGV